MKKITTNVKLFLTFFSFLPVLALKAQNVGINNTKAKPNASAMLDVSSVNKGVLIPSVNLQGVNLAAPITSPATSLLVYNTNAALPQGRGYYYNSGSPNVPAWIKLVDGIGASGWLLTGNAGINPVNNFLGTIDNRNVIFKRGGVKTLELTTGGALLATGDATGVTPATGLGTRMMWIPASAAFRAGFVLSTNWDAGNIGQYSFAAGNDPKASGNYSVSMGFHTVASGGDAATAIGRETVASGNGSAAFGYGTQASGEASTSTGLGTKAIGLASTATGNNTTASGSHSASMGFNTLSEANGGLAIGRWNAKQDIIPNDVQHLTDKVFQIGNGTGDNSRSDALFVLRTGDVTIAGMLTENSDIRLKTKITPLDNVLDKITDIQPISYNFKPGINHSSKRQIGFNAQEIEKQFPELVSKDSKGYLSVSYTNMSAVLLQAIKEQQEQYIQFRNEYDSKLNSLEQQNRLLLKKLELLEQKINK